MLFLVIIWLIFWADNFWNLDLYLLGVNPRTISGLKGILFAPLIHGDLNHILNNSLPVLILGSMIFIFINPLHGLQFLDLFSKWSLVMGRRSQQRCYS